MKLFPIIRYYRVFKRFFLHFLILLFHLLKRWAGLAVNYLIYYFRRGILMQNDQKARKLSDKEYKIYLAHRQRQNEQSATTPIASEIEKSAFSEGKLTPDNLHVNALWVGNRLSKIELLTLQSFVDNGHIFHLWTYENILNELPDGVIMEDANEILPSEKIFRYKYFNKYGHGKGSVSGFSDIFRYKLLYEKGGWWTDMDVTCLKPLNVATPYFFRKHQDLELVGNVMKCPARSSLMLSCYEEASREVDETNTDWHKPIEILNKYVFVNRLQEFIYPHVSNVDVWSEIVGFIIGNQPIPDNYYFIHWMNEEWRSRDIDKNDFRFQSELGKIMINAGLLQKPVSRVVYFFNDLWHLVFLRIYYNS